jgi:glutathione S-transferase
VAVARFQVRYLGKSVSELEPRLVERGLSALARLETAVADAAFLLGDAPSLADIALSAYTRMAEDGGFRLSEFPQVSAWLERVEEAIGITDPR